MNKGLLIIVIKTSQSSTCFLLTNLSQPQARNQSQLTNNYIHLRLLYLWNSLQGHQSINVIWKLKNLGFLPSNPVLQKSTTPLDKDSAQLLGMPWVYDLGPTHSLRKLTQVLTFVIKTFWTHIATFMLALRLNNTNANVCHSTLFQPHSYIYASM